MLKFKGYRPELRNSRLPDSTSGEHSLGSKAVLGSRATKNRLRDQDVPSDGVYGGGSFVIWVYRPELRPSEYAVYGLFAVLVVLTFWDTLFGQYIFRLDMLFAPVTHFNIENLRNGVGVYSSVFYNAVLWLLNTVLPGFVVQKIVLISIFMATPIGMFRATKQHGTLPAVLAAIFYTYNPFVFDRIMAGQWLFLSGYALAPFVFVAAHRYFKNQQYPLWKIVGITTLSGLLSVHFFILNLLLITAVWLLHTKHITQERLWRLLKAIVWIVFINSWWIIPLLNAPPTTLLSADDPQAFQTRPDAEFGLLFNVVTLHGFWREDWLVLKNFIAWWPLLMGAWLLPVAMGLGVLWRRNHRKAAILSGFAAVMVVMSLGLAPGVYRINSWLYSVVPGFAGFRESQKFLALAVLIYAIIAARGFQYITTAYKWALLPLSLIVLVVAWPFMFAAQGQLLTTTYSNGWHEFRTVLAQETNSKVLVLPWDQYLSGSFMQTVAAAPTFTNYGDVIIQNQNPRLAGLADRTPTQYHSISHAVDSEDPQHLQQVLEQFEITHVLMIKSDNLLQYDWFSPQDFGSVIIDDHQMSVIRVNRLEVNRLDLKLKH